MNRLVATFAVVLALGMFAPSGETFGIDLIGVHIPLKIPSLNFGNAVSNLISPLLALQILQRPVDYQHALGDCASHTNSSNVARNGLSATNRRWYQNSDGTWFVPIVMDSAFKTDERNTIYAGMINIQDNTCMRFYIYNEADLKGFDYVRIVRGSGQGCYSNYIGRAGVGRQIVNLQPMEPSGCIVAGIAAHELLHAIGFDHEQCTPGRNDYVTIMYNNIQSGYEHNFDEDSPSQYTGFGAPYDYGSVMHYGKTAFSKNQQNTIVVKQSGATIGQRSGVSKWDAYKVQKMHGCAT